MFQMNILEHYEINIIWDTGEYIFYAVRYFLGSGKILF